MHYTTTVTQKGQITIPKALRDQYGITMRSKVLMVADSNGILIEPTQDILALAGTLMPKEKKYTRF